MSEKNVDNLKTYLRADYARQIAAENRDKPIQERWRLIRDSDEHKHRQQFARARSKWILIIGFSTLLAFYIVMVLFGVSPDDPTNLTVGSYRFPDWLTMSISILVGLAIGVAGWLIGNKRARAQLAAQRSPS
jgi:hypothetical protein